MSTTIPVPAPEPAAAPPAPEPPSRGRAGSSLRRFLVWLVVCGGIASAGWFGVAAYRKMMTAKESPIPTARVQRGDVILSVTARGALRGGNSEVLTAPLTGGTELHITLLRGPGEEVKTGDAVVQLDTTEQEYKLREAEADLAEAQQKRIQAKAQQQAEEEEDRYALLKAQADIRTAELDVKKNPMLPSITARENDLALDAARDRLAQLQRNITNRKATNDAAIAIQDAAAGKAESQAKTARENIQAMTLKAHRDGYVSIKQNMSGNMLFFGMALPLYQSGDAVRPGMAIAEIPDLKSWEIGAAIGELDRGHLAAGDKVAVTVIAVPNRSYTGRIKELGGTNGPPWDRHFECTISLDNPTPELRPGMSATIVVTTDELRQVLSLPAQALFESDGRTFVYVRSGGGFSARDVKLARRSETRVVITGVREGDEVALANPAELSKKKAAAGGAMKSLPK